MTDMTKERRDELREEWTLFEQRFGPNAVGVPRTRVSDMLALLDALDIDLLLVDAKTGNPL